MDKLTASTPPRLGQFSAPDPERLRVFQALDQKARQLIRRLVSERPDLAGMYLAAQAQEDVAEFNAMRIQAMGEFHAWLGEDASAFPSARDLLGFVNINRPLLETMMADREQAGRDSG